MEKRYGIFGISILFMIVLLLGVFLFVGTDNVSADVVEGDYIYSTSGEPLVATVTGYLGDGGAITIPSTLGGYDTVAIGDYAFQENPSLTAVTIPGSVTTLGQHVFSSSNNLLSITFQGLVAPDVDPHWVASTNANLRGHASAASNFPAPTNLFVGLTMGDYISEDYIYTVTEGKATITGYTGAGGAITIPSTLGGYPTIAIGNGAFFNAQGHLVTSVIIPDSVTSIGSFAFQSCSHLTSATIGNGVIVMGDGAFLLCESLTTVTFTPTSKVATIGAGAFEQCTKLTSITIPNSVTSIGASAFSSCLALTPLTIPNSVTSIGDNAFRYCQSLTSVTIPNSVTIIKYNTFEFCTSLTTVTMGNGVTSIETSAFESCYDLNSITFHGLVAPTTVGANWITSTPAEIRGHAYYGSNFPAPGSTFNGLTMGTVIDEGGYNYTVSEGKATITGYTGAGGDITIPSTLGGVPTIAIGDSAFDSAKGNLVTSVIIPDIITSIGDSAFYSCIKLTSVTIGNGVTTIGDWAFYSCTNLTSVTIGNGVTSIGGFAFLSCTSLTTVTFTPTSKVATIGFGAFNSCSALTSITIPDSVTTLNSAVFESCTSLTSVTIGNGVTSIGATTFYSCTSLTTVTFTPTSKVATIGANAFYSCTKLTSITIPNSVTTIGNNAFDSCYDLTSVTIGSGVITIGNYAFYSCTKLTSITIPNSVTAIGTDAFSFCTHLTSVTIGSGLSSIGEDAFFYCIDLTAITVDDDNVNFANNAGDGVLYNKAITTLVLYPIGNARTSFTIPGSVITIGEYAFSWGAHLISVTIGNSVTTIGANAFESCYAMTSIIFLGHDVPSVGTNWIQNTPDEIIGHAYFGTHFPTPGNIFPEEHSRGDNGLLMSVGDLTHYDIVVDGDQIAGVGFTGTVTAKDAYENIVPIDKTLTALRDGDANLYSGPGYDTELYTCTLVDGVGTIYVKDTTAETITLTVLEDPPSSIYGYCYVLIKPAAIDHFGVTGVPTFSIAGSSWAGGSGTVTAYDVYDNVKTDYTGQVYFTSTDGAATLPYTVGSKYTFTTGEGNDNGVHAFNGAGFTLFTAGSRTITITDGEVSLTSGSITVNPAAIDHFTVTGITDPVVAGILSSVTVTAYDVYDNVKTNYVGTIQFTSSDVKGTTVLPDDYTFLLSDEGVKTFDDGIKLTTTGDQSVTVTSTVGEKTGSQTEITVNPAAIDHYHVASSTPQIAGVGWSGTATAQDAFHNVVTTDSATVVTMTETGAAQFYTNGDYDELGNTYTLSSGIATFYVKDTTAETITLTATSAGPKTGTSGNIVVNPASIDHYHVASTSPQIAGVGWSGTATAQDAFHNVVTTDSATVVTMTETGAALFYTDGDYDVLGNTYTLSAGIATFYVKDTTAETITLTGTDEEENSGSIADILVNPAAIDHFTVAGITDPVVAGVLSSVTVTAYDAYDNVKTDYIGTVHFTSTDVKATTVLPEDYIFLLSDEGVKTFEDGIKLTTTGDQSVTVTSTVGEKTGSQTEITVNPAAIDHYHVASSTPQIAGAGWSGTATAKDEFDNTVTTDSATVVTMTESGAAEFYTDGDYDVLGNTYTLSAGIATFYVKDTTAQTIVLTATDEMDKTGNIINITVNPAAIDHYHVASSTPQIAGVGWSGTATAQDAFHNVVTTDSATEVTMTATGAAEFYTSDTFETLENMYTLSSGIATFYVKDNAAETITLTVTDLEENSGSIADILVNPAAIDHYHVASSTPQTAGVGWSGTATAQDAFHNVVTTDSATVVTMTETGAALFYTDGDYDVLGNTYTLSAGIATFFVKDTTAETITLTATSAGPKSGTSGNVVVNPAAIDHYHVASTTPQIAGAGWSGTATAKDEFDNTVTTDSATVVTMTESGDAAFYTDGDYDVETTTFTLSAGIATFYVKDTTAETMTLTATDAEENTGSIDDIVVNPASINHYHVASTSPQIAGVGWSGTATAQDEFHNVVTTDSATVVTMTESGDAAFYTSDTYGTLGSTYTLSSGIATFYVKDTTAETITLTATDTEENTGSIADILVNPAAIDHYHVASSTPQIAGAGWSGTATAKDEFDNTVTTDSVTVVTLTESGNAAFYTDGDYDVETTTYTLSAGIATFYVKDTTAETITLTATSAGPKTGTSGNVVVNPAAIDHYHVASSTPQIAGVGWSGTATAQDAFHNVVTTDSATEVTMTESGDAAFYTDGDYDVETTTYTLSAGIATFYVKDTTAETITLTATSAGPKTGSIANIIVNPAAIDHFDVVVGGEPLTKVAGALWSTDANDVIVTAHDEFSNVVTGYTGSPVWSASCAGTLPVAQAFELGTYTFIGTGFALNIAGEQTITITGAGDVHGHSDVITIVPSALTHYDIDVDGDQVAGVGFTGTVTAKDVYDNTVSVAKTLTSLRTGDANLYSGPGYVTELYTCTLVAGVGTLYVKDTTAETITLTVLEVPPSAIFGFCYVLINPAAIDHYHVASDSPQTAGEGWSGTATAQDAFHNVVTTDSTTEVMLTESGAALFYTDGDYDVLGSTYILGSGIATFFVKDTTAETITLTATDEMDKTGNIADILVNPAAINHYHVASTTPQTAGEGWSGTATAQDAFHNVVTTDSATVVTMTDNGNAAFCTDGSYVTETSSYTLSAGVATFYVRDTVAETITLTATSAGPKTGSIANIVVNPSAIDHYHVASSTPQTAGVGWSGTATAKDEFDNTVTTDSATVVTMTSTGAAAFYTSGTYGTLGNTYALSSGVATFYIKDNTAQTITLTATDADENTGSIANIVVNPAAINHYHVASTTPQTAGVGWSGTATAQDAFHNVVATDSTTEVTMTNSGDAVFYTDGDYDVETTTYTLSAGVATFFVMDTTAEIITLTATSSGEKTGTTSNILVNPVAIDHYHIASESPQTAGAGWSGTVTAKDVFDNTVTTDSVTVVTLTESGNAAFYTDGDYDVLGNTYTLSSGVATFFVKDTTAETITLTATDPAEKTGTSGNIVVNPAAIDHFTVTGISDPVVAGVLSSVTVTAYDVYDNVKTNYVGTIQFSSTDVKGTTVLPGDYTFLLSDAGVKSFEDGIKLTTTGDQSVTVTSTVGEKTGSQTAITVNPAAIDHYHVASTSPQIAGVGWSGTATAQDAFHNVVATDSTTEVTMTNSGDAVFYTDGDYDVETTTYTLSAGVATFYVRDTVAETITLTATDPAEKTGTSGNIVVNPAAIDHFTVVGITDPVVAGALTSPIVTAYDIYDNVKTNYVGSIHFTSDDVKGTTLLPADHAFVLGDAGVHVFTNGVKLTTTGEKYVKVQDTVTDTAVGQQSAITVNPAALDHFTMTGVPEDCIAGTSWDGGSGTATAYDVYDNVKTDYTGQVYFTSTDEAATLPYTLGSKYTFTSGADMDNGVHLFDGAGFTLFTAGSRTITITTGVISLTSASITVIPAVLDHFTVVGITDPVVAGVLTSPTVTAYDAYDNVKTDYIGTIHFSSTDVKETTVLPDDYTFLLADAGVKTFTDGVKLTTTGDQSVTVTNTVGMKAIIVTGIIGSQTGSQTAITVNPAAIDHYHVASTTPQTAGAGWSGTATAQDAFHNVVTTDSATVVTMTATGAAVFYTDGDYDVLGNTYALSSGIATFYVKDTTAQTITLTANDPAEKTGSIADIMINPAAIDHFIVTGITDPVEVDVLTSPTVTAYDAYDNVKTDYVGTIHFTSDDVKGTTVLPGDYTFLLSDAGVKTFTDGVKLTTAGEKYVKVQDTITIAAEGQQGSITVYTVPDAPTGLTAIASNAQVTLNWTAPAYDGGSVITGYKIYRSTAQAGVYTLIASPTGTTYIDTGRINGHIYWYNVSTVNAAGEGAKGALVSSTPYTVPNAPTGLTALAGNAQVTLNWTAPAFNGGSPIDYYVIYQDGVALAAHPTVLTIAITGLDNGASYSFVVAAHNIAGIGAQSGAITSTPYTVPNAPTGLTAIAGSTQVTLNWTAPAFNGGSVIIGYNVYRSMTETGTYALIASPTELNFTDTELTNGQTYWYNVSAVNAAGESVKTVIVSSMPCTVPNAPTGLIATAIYGQVTLTWTAPTSTGGSPIAKYNVYRGLSDATMVMIGNSTSATFVDTAATAGSTYHYKVSATNVVGEGAMSASASVPVPLTVPIIGKITDSNGNGLAGITVALENGTSVKTDANGNFTIFATPGNHTLTISGPGIETKTMSATVTTSGLAIGKLTTTKATDYLPIMVVLFIIAALMLILFLVMRRRRKK